MENKDDKENVKKVKSIKRMKSQTTKSNKNVTKPATKEKKITKLPQKKEKQNEVEKEVKEEKKLSGDVPEKELTKKEKNAHKKTRRNLVLLVLLLAFIVIYVVERGKYLEIMEIGENYVTLFWQNLKNISITAILNFIVVFWLMYTTTKQIKIGLRTFFDDEKKPMPKLPQKSVAFIVAILVTIFTSEIICKSAILCFNNTKFVTTDPVFGYDVGYFVFIWPFIELLVMYALVAVVALTVYSALYYLIVFNLCFDGIDRETVKKSAILDQALGKLKWLVVLFALFVLVQNQNIGVQKFINLTTDQTENYEIFGAGSTEIYIKFWAYIVLAIIIVISAFKAIKNFRKGNNKKGVKNILFVPIYLIVIALVMLGYNLIFVNSNELDKEKKYIADNIKYTKMGYNIDIDNVSETDGGTITQTSIDENANTINNIPITNSELVLKDLNNSLTSKKYYEYISTKLGLYQINGKNSLVFVTPREISEGNGTYNNKTYEYTHGYGVILTSATSTTSTGNLNHIQKSFENANEAIDITKPRIYFGLNTKSTVVTNSNSKKEFDYPTLDGSSNTENIYDGTAGLQVNFLDKIILAIKEKDAKLAFSGNVKSDSKILTNRNIISRAKTVMPYLTYDENPYMVVTNSGELVWVLDAYTTSNNYPYSQRTVLKSNGINKNEINYIRNSVKVIINAYSGKVTFYITDLNDPIAVAYKHIYPDLFSTEKIPEDISAHFVYPEYLYEVQSEILERYHANEADDLYRSDDVWDIATYNTSKVSTKDGTVMKPYYTMVKTTDSSAERFGLVLPYTPYDKQNITAYLVGSIDENGNNVLKLYSYSSDSNVIGPMELDTQIAQDTTISKEIDTLNVSGTKLIKDMIIVPVNNTLIYIEPIYQQYVNETDSLPTLKKVVVASGSKVAIGDNLTSALNNLVSQYAVEIEVKNTDSINDLVDAIVKANNNLKESTKSNDWEQIGRDTKKLQDLVTRMEEVKKAIDEKKTESSSQTATNAVNEVVNTVQ